MQQFGLDANLPLLHCLIMVIDYLSAQHDYILTLVVVDYIQVLQCRNHVLFLYTSQFAYFPFQTKNNNKRIISRPLLIPKNFA